MLIAFHGIGREFQGVLACSASWFQRVETQDGEREVGPVTPVTDSVFLINYKEPLDEATERFSEWLEDAVVRGLKLWQETALQGRSEDGRSLLAPGRWPRHRPDTWTSVRATEGSRRGPVQIGPQPVFDVPCGPDCIVGYMRGNASRSTSNLLYISLLSVSCGGAISAALLGKRVAPGAGQLSVGEGQLASLGQGDEPGGAEPKFAPASADDDPLDPASGSGRLDEQVQPVAVCVPPWRGGTDEGSREGLVGVASSALGSAGHGGGLDYNIHSTIICRIGPDFTAHPDPPSLRIRINFRDLARPRNYEKRAEIRGVWFR